MNISKWSSPREFVVLDVEQGDIMEAQSGLQMNRPRIYGVLAGPGKGRVGAIVMHPTSNFMDHFLMEPLSAHGVGVLGLNTRYAGNDSVLLMEQAIQDLGAGVGFMRERYDKVVLIGYSGGAALTCFYQAQAEEISVFATPAGDPITLDSRRLPPADGIVLMGAHLGRSRLLRDWLDAAVVDELRPHQSDVELDIYSPSNPAPFSDDLYQRIRAAQTMRSERITRAVEARLRELKTQKDGPSNEPMLVFRTYADPRFLDLTKDANDREAGGNRGNNPREMNYGVNSLGRYTSLKAWMSQWSLKSNADGPTNLRKTTVPVLHLELTADGSVFPSAIAEWSEAIRSDGRQHRETFHRIEKATHYMKNQPAQIQEAAQRIADWVN